MRTAIAYIRVSTEEQATTGASLAAQESAIRAYCAMRGLELVERLDRVEAMVVGLDGVVHTSSGL